MSGRAGFPGVVTKDLREVRRGVAEASDAQVLMVVRMVDALEERGATDAVLTPVRPRLRALHPPRPLRFARLLFMPVDPLIVAPSVWRPGTPFLPRNALIPLAQAVRAVMGQPTAPTRLRDSLGEIDALIANATTAERDRVRAAGALLWEGAAQAFRLIGGGGLGAKLGADCAAVWAEAGLPASELVVLAQCLAVIMEAALSLYDRDHRGIALAEHQLAELLARAESMGARPWCWMLSLLVIRLPEAGAALLTAGHANRRNRALADAAVESALAWVEAEAAEPVSVMSPDAANVLNRQVMLLDTLAGQTPDERQKRRLASARARLAETSLQRYAACLQGHLCGGLRALPQDQDGLAAGLAAMEATARMMRAFELEARRLGAAAQLDACVQQASATVLEAPGLSRMDRARLTEIIAGSEAALRILQL
jgi:hypothetical protein